MLGIIINENDKNQKNRLAYGWILPYLLLPSMGYPQQDLQAHTQNLHFYLKQLTESGAYRNHQNLNKLN